MLYGCGLRRQERLARACGALFAQERGHAHSGGEWTLGLFRCVFVRREAGAGGSDGARSGRDAPGQLGLDATARGGLRAPLGDRANAPGLWE